MDRELWPHQKYAIDTSIQKIESGLRSFCVTSPTGGGKSTIVQGLCEYAASVDKRVALFTNRKLLTNQLARGLSASGIHLGVRAAEFESWTDLNAPVQICSTPTEVARVINRRKKAIDRLMPEEEAHSTYSLFPAEIVLIDECFVGETIIETVSGSHRIDNVRSGDYVYCASGIGRVEAVSCKLASDLVTLEFDDGTTCTCTGNHKFFTTNGWIEARSMDGESTFSPEDVRGLWCCVQAVEDSKKRNYGSSARSGMAQAEVLLEILLKEIEQPDAQPGYRGEGQEEAERNAPQANQERRQRAIASLATNRFASRTRGRVGGGSVNSYWNQTEERPWVSNELQDGYCEQGKEDCDRNRRGYSRLSDSQENRCEENSIGGLVRVVRVSRYEREGATPVFNIHVSGHPSYFANGKLVHNCHMNASGRMEAIIKEYREKHDSTIIGVTATPLGVSHICSELIVAGNMTSLRACGALVPAMCFQPTVWDLAKVYRAKHELPSQNSMEAATRAIWTQHVVGSIYKHWTKINPDAKATIAFAPGVKESLGMAKEFSAHGVRSAHISGEGMWVDGKEYKGAKQEDRDEVFAMSKSGEIQVIWNRFVLREAIDLPWLECLILACPIASLLSYIQTAGRVLRASPSTGKKSAVIIDHAGTIELHGSPNMDRDQQWIQYFNEDEDKITKDRVNQLRDPENQEQTAITCPKCGAMRKSGPKCINPACGFEHSESVRYILQEHGELVATKESFMPKRKPKMKADTAKLWERCYWRCKNSKTPKSFNQARALFIHEHGYSPPQGLPMMPKSPLDWSRKIQNVGYSDLIQKPK